MVEFSLPANSKIKQGKTYKAPEGAKRVKNFRVYRWHPDGSVSGSGHESHLGSFAAVIWAFYEGILGLQPDFNGLHIRPNLPRELDGTAVELWYHGSILRVHFQGAGKRVAGVLVNGERLVRPLISWHNLKPENTVAVHLR